jgi:hypothetical protein
MADVYEDIRNNRPVLPAEMRAVQDYETRQRQAADEARREEERIANLFPAKRQEMVKDLAEFYGIADLNSTEGQAFQYKFDKHWEALTRDARSTFTQPVIKEIGRVMWDALGRTPEAADAIRRLPADPMALIPALIEVGRGMGLGPSPDVAPEAEVAKWQDGGKLDPKKLITVEQAEARLNKALDIERRARGIAPPPVGGGRESRPGKGLTLTEIENERVDVWMARPKEERDRLLKEAHEAASRGAR